MVIKSVKDKFYNRKLSNTNNHTIQQKELKSLKSKTTGCEVPVTEMSVRDQWQLAVVKCQYQS